MKKVLAILILLSVLFTSFGCQNQEDNEEASEEENQEQSVNIIDLNKELHNALTISESSNFLNSVNGKVSANFDAYNVEPKHTENPDDSMITVDSLELFVNDGLDDFISAFEKNQANRIEDSVNQMNKAMENFQKSFDKLADDLSTQFISKALMSVGVEAATYIIKLAAKQLLENLGFDTRSNDEKILDKLELLDDIYASVKKIEESLNKLSLQIKDKEYYELMDKRHSDLSSLSNATTSTYLALFDYLTEGYEEYLEKAYYFEKLITDANFFTKKDENGQYVFSVEKLKELNFDKDFFVKYCFMQKMPDYTKKYPTVDLSEFSVNSLALYMQYKLQYCTQSFRNTVQIWAAQVINGNTITVEILNMLDRFSGGLLADGSTYPQIYDYCAYRLFAWEHEGYEMRESARKVDSMVMNECSFMLEIYYAIFGDANTVAANRKTLNDYLSKYNELLAEHEVIRHENYYICQLIGCQYVFAKTPVYFDYYHGIGWVLDYALEGSEGWQTSSIPTSTFEAYHDRLFHNELMTYDYSLLTDTQKENEYTFSHLTTNSSFKLVKAAYSNPIRKVDFEEVDTFATTLSDAVYYIPRSAYEVIYKYYYALYPKEVKSIKDALYIALNMEFSDDAQIVCDYIDSGLEYADSSSGFIENKYYINAFEFCIKHWETNDDYIKIRCCLEDDCSGVKSVRFATDMNISTDDTLINNKGSADPYNRFAGLMVVGIPDYVINYDSLN